MNNQTDLQSKLTLLERLQGPTSPFFKPLVYGGAIVAAISGALAIFQGYLIQHGMPVPEAVAHVAEIVAYVAGAVAAVSKLTVNFNITEGK